MSEINPNIFRAYDIRGIYPEEINPEVAYKVGRSLVKFLRKHSKSKSLKIVVGRDNRLSSPILCRALKKGILEEGADVIDIGLSPTPMFYFAVWKYNFDGGVQLTASHNPPQYNGFKMVKKKAIIIGGNSGLKEIKKLALRKEKRSRVKKGKIKKKKVLKDYLKFNFSQINLRKIKPLKIAVDTGNGVSGILIPQISKKFPGKIYHLFPKLDGSFPNHLPDPSEEKNLKKLEKFVKEKKLNLGIAFDGDGDRIIFVDEGGKMIASGFIVALMAQMILRESPGEKILHDISMSKIVDDTVKENGGIPLTSKVGFTFVKEKMMKNNVIFAGEYSGHYYHQAHNFCEAPLFILFKILEEMSETERTISQLLAPFKRYFHSGRINLKIKDRKRVLGLLERKYKKGKIFHPDGLKVSFKDWWFNVRPSNTEDLLRLVVEAKTKSLMKERLEEIIKIIEKS